MSSAAIQPDRVALFPEVLFLTSVAGPVGKGENSHGPERTASRRSSLGPGLLRGKDFILPKLVGEAENGDVAVAGCIDHSQTIQVFGLLDVKEEHRDFASLSDAERHLEERRYKDWLKRNAKKGRCCDELEVWLEGGEQAQENFHLWWERKEERRRTALARKANRLANCRVTGRRLDCCEHSDHRFFGPFNCGVRYCRHCGSAIFAELF